MALQFGHEALAEPHHFVVALALGIEIRTALAAAHHQSRQRVLENLLEGQELQDAEIDRRMKAQAALIRPDGAVHLDAVTAVDPHGAEIVEPRHAEQDDPFGFHDAFEQVCRLVFRMLAQNETQRIQHFLYRLMKLRFGRVLRLHLIHDFVDIVTRRGFGPV